MADGSVPIVLSPEPFARTTTYVEAPAGCTVRTMLASAISHGHLKLDDLPRTNVYVDGARIDREEALGHVLDEGQIVNVVVEPLGGGGGGGGKDVGQILLTIAVIAVSMWVSGGAATPAGLFDKLLVRQVMAAAVLTGGQMAIGALFKPETNVSKVNDRYALSSASNQYRQWGAMPLALGEVVVAPDLAVKTFTQAQGEDQWIYGILGLHYGPCTADDLKIGDTLVSSMGAGDVRVAYHLTPGPRTFSIVANDTDQLDLQEELAATVSGSTAIVRAASAEGERFEFDFFMPQGLYFAKDDGRKLAAGLTVTIRYRPIDQNGVPTGSGAWVSGLTIPLSSSSSDPWRIMRSISLPLGRYEFEVKRSKLEDDSAKRKTDIGWTAIRAIAFRKPVLDETLSLVEFAVRASALNQGNLAPFTCRITPVCETWNGTAWGAPAPTSNPAAITRWLMTGPAPAIPLKKPQADVGLRTWAALCDQYNWKSHIYLTEDRKQDAVMQLLGMNGRASLFWDGTQLVSAPWVEKPAPRQLFAGSNLKDHRWEIVYPDPVHALRVEFQNIDQGGEADEIYVYADGYGEAADPANNILPATLVEALRLEGQQTIERAYRDGRWNLGARMHQRRVDSWSTDIEHIVCRYGDRVRLAWDRVGTANATVRNRLWSGALVSGLRLSQPVRMEPGRTYALDLRLPDQVLTGVPIVNPATTADVVTRTILFADLRSANVSPRGGDLVAFGEPERISEDVEIIGITPGTDLTANMVGIRYVAPLLMAGETGPIPPLQSRLTRDRAKDPPMPTLLGWQANEEGVWVGFSMPPWRGSPITGFTVRWRQTPAVGQSSAWVPLPDLPATAMTAVTPPLRELPAESTNVTSAQVEIVAMTADGRASPPLLLEVNLSAVEAPVAGTWLVSPRGVDTDGTQQPGLRVIGGVDRERVATVLIEYATSAAGPWTPAYSGSWTTQAYDIGGLEPLTDYWVAVSYASSQGVPGPRQVVGPVRTGALSVPVQPYARDLAKGGFASTADMPKSSAVTYSTPNGTGQLRVTYPATGTSLYFGWTLGRPGAKAYVLRARVRAAADPITAAHWDGRLTYATAALAHSLTVGRMASLAFPGDITAGKWRVLEWEADSLTDYLTSTIDAVRLYLLKSGAPPIDLDWLEVGYREGATANIGKLADQDNVDFDSDIVGPGKPVSGAGKIFADAVTANLTPAGYAALLPTGGTRLEIKDSASLGNVRAAGNTVVQTDAPASGWAGMVQVMRTPTQGSFKRSASTATAWRGWTRAYDEEQKPLFGYDLEETPGVLATVAAYKTGVGTSAFVQGQGALATKDAVDFDADISGDKPSATAGRVVDRRETNDTPQYYLTLLSGRGTISELKVPATVGNSRLSDAFAVVTTEAYSSSLAYPPVQTMRGKSGTYRRVASTATAWLGWTKVFGEDIKPAFGSDLLTGGGAVATDAAYQTGQGTSAFVAGQGKLATQDAADFDVDVAGPNKPAAMAGRVYTGAESTDSTPADYVALVGIPGVRLERKNPASIGNTRAENTHSNVETRVHGGASSQVIQTMIERSGTMWQRRGSTTTSWRGWVKFYNEDAKAAFNGDLLTSGGSVATDAAYQTGQGTSAFVNGQGKLATQDAADFDADVSGPNKPQSGAGRIFDNATTVNTTPSDYSALIGGSGGVRVEVKDAQAVELPSSRATGLVIVTTQIRPGTSDNIIQVMRTPTQGSFKRTKSTGTSWRGWTKELSEEQKPIFGFDLEETAGVLASLANFKTGLGTSAFVQGQGALATKDAVDFDADVSGPNKPTAGAGKVYDNAKNTNTTPNGYVSLLPAGGVRTEIKSATSLGNSRASGDTVVTTEVPPGAFVGVTQTMRSATQGTFKRVSNTGTSWRGWTKAYDEDARPAFGSDLLTAGGAVATDAAYQTGLGTSKFIENQGPAATGSDTDYKTSVGYAAGMNGVPLNGATGTVDLPSVYRARGVATYNERKAASIAGGSGAQYGTLRTEVTDPRTDRPIIQQYIFSSGLVYQRESVTGDASWTDWRKSYNQDQKPTFGDGIPRNAASGNGVVLTPSRPLAPVTGFADTRISVAATSAKFGDGSTLSLPSATLTGLTSNTAYAVFRRFSTNSYVATASAATRANYQTDDDYLLLGLQVTAQTSGGAYSPPPPPPAGGGGGLSPWTYEQI